METTVQIFISWKPDEVPFGPRCILTWKIYPIVLVNCTIIQYDFYKHCSTELAALELTDIIHEEIFKSVFTYNHELYETETSSHGMLHQYIPRVLLVPVMYYWNIIRVSIKPYGKVRTHSISTFVCHVKSYMISSYSYGCIQMNYYIWHRNP